MNKIEAHINKLFSELPDSRRKEELMQEITQNLNEKVADLVSQGQTEESAVQKAIDDFGDIDDIREELESSAKLAQSSRVGLSLAFSIWGSVLIAALVVFINLYYTPHVIWFVYPVFAVIWWPMAMFFHWIHKKTDRPVGLAFSLVSFVLIMALLLFINYYYTPNIIWFVYPAFGLIWWPMAMFFHRLRQKSREDD